MAQPALGSALQLAADDECVVIFKAVPLIPTPDGSLALNNLSCIFKGFLREAGKERPWGVIVEVLGAGLVVTFPLSDVYIGKRNRVAQARVGLM